jgi:hypothetical protein
LLALQNIEYKTKKDQLFLQSKSHQKSNKIYIKKNNQQLAFTQLQLVDSGLAYNSGTKRSSFLNVVSCKYDKKRKPALLQLWIFLHLGS